MATKKQDVNTFDTFGGEQLVTDIVGWWKPEKGKILIGKLQGFKKLGNENRYFYLIEVNEPTPCVLKGGDEVIAQPGQCVGLGESFKLSELRSLVKNKCEVCIRADDKRSIGGGKNMWDYTIRYKGEKAPLAAADVLGINTEDPEDVPF